MMNGLLMAVCVCASASAIASPGKSEYSCQIAQDAAPAGFKREIRMNIRLLSPDVVFIRYYGKDAPQPDPGSPAMGNDPWGSSNDPWNPNEPGTWVEWPSDEPVVNAQEATYVKFGKSSKRMISYRAISPEQDLLLTSQNEPWGSTGPSTLQISTEMMQGKPLAEASLKQGQAGSYGSSISHNFICKKTR